jgi:hypothetical protein
MKKKQNNAVGCCLFNRYYKNKPLYMKVRIGRWTVVRIRWGYIAVKRRSIPRSARLVNKAKYQSVKIPKAERKNYTNFSKYNADQLIYLY